MSLQRIEIINPADGGFFYWLFKYSLCAAVFLVMLVLHGLLGIYVYFARSVPQVPDLANYAERAPGITTVYAGDGTLLAEFAKERREVVPWSRIPQPLIDATIATEDRRFYEHRGLDLRGFGRALRENLRQGRISQGGSTITQQVAKAFLSPERTFTRKIREAILARRLEARYSKREILTLYLNHIFLGHDSYGVQAAARRYFDKNVWDLDLPELALLAGLAKAPTRYSPIEHPLAAQARRDTVLRNMVETGYLSAERIQPYLGQPVQLKPRRDASRDVSPYFVDHVRRELGRQIGQQALYEGGYRVETTVLPSIDVLAAENVDHATRQLDKRQGYRGPEARLDSDGQRLFLARAKARYAGPLRENTLYLGLVTAVRQSGATVQVGPHTLELPLLNMLWAARYIPHDSTNDRLISSAAEALRPGDVIWVKLAFRSHIPRFSEYVYTPLTTKTAGSKEAKDGKDGEEAAADKKSPAATASSRRPMPAGQKGKSVGAGKGGGSHELHAGRGARGGGDGHRPMPTEAAREPAARIIPGTGVQVMFDGYRARLAAQPSAPGKRTEVGEATWLPEQTRKAGANSLKEVVLEQAPRPQGALYTFDLRTGYVLAMAGGNEYERSEFNRVVQACRQPGSAYKPIYYSLALDRGYSFDTIWNDKIHTEIDPVTGEEWVPQNIDGSYGQMVNLERALVWSKNPPSLEIFKTLGKKDVAAWARRLGMTTPIHADDALALGASCVRIDELSRAFALFATNGRPVESVAVKRVLSRRGEVIYDASAWDDPMLDGRSRLDRLIAMGGRMRRPVIPPRTAYLTGTLLRRVVTQGHSKPIRDAKLIAAGKTGTSSRTSDVWFVGHTSRWLTTAWVGDDTYERQLGYADASFTISVPMWTRYMYAASRDMPLTELPAERPASVKPNDRGGPLLPGFPPPPLLALGAEARVYQLPEHLRHLRVVPSGAGKDAGKEAGAGGSKTPSRPGTQPGRPVGAVKKQPPGRRQPAPPVVLF